MFGNTTYYPPVIHGAGSSVLKKELMLTRTTKCLRKASWALCWKGEWEQEAPKYTKRTKWLKAVKVSALKWLVGVLI